LRERVGLTQREIEKVRERVRGEEERESELTGRGRRRGATCREGRERIGVTVRAGKRGKKKSVQKI
jgi:hypothetical protein